MQRQMIEYQRIAGLERSLAVIPRPTRFNTEHAGGRQLPQTCIQARVDPDLGQLVIVESGTAHCVALDVKAQRPDQVQRAAGIGT